MSGRNVITLAGIAGAAMLFGCASHAAPRASMVGTPRVSRSLVLPSAEMMDAAPQALADWEYARNDALLGSPPRELPALAEYGETRSYDRRWTINGQPREFSGTFLYSVQRRIGP